MKRVFCCILALIMICGCLPAVAFAASSGTPDGTAPTLTSLTFSATEIKAPGTIEVVLKGGDDVSGLDEVSIDFWCEEPSEPIHCDLYNYDIDEVIPDLQHYPEGEFHGILEFNQYCPEKEIRITQIDLADRAGNRVHYSSGDLTGSDSDYVPMPQELKDLRLKIKASDTPDLEKPELISVSFSAAAVSAGAEVEVTAECKDDSSGVKYINLSVQRQQTGETYSIQLDGTYYEYDGKGEYVEKPYPDGKFHGSLRTSEYWTESDFRVVWAEFRDRAGHFAWYNEEMLPEAARASFHMTGSKTPDTTPPTFQELKLAVEVISAPGIVPVTVMAEDDLSGVEFGHFVMTCPETGKKLYGSLHDFIPSHLYRDVDEIQRLPEGMFRADIEVDPYMLSGTFVLDRLELQDEAFNRTVYVRDADAYNYSDKAVVKELTEELKAVKLQVLNAEPDVTTSVANADFVQKVSGAKEDAYIVADYSSKGTLPKETFEALAGTDKTLDLVSNGVTWRFQGGDIVNDAKEIDLNVRVTRVDRDSSESAKAIQDELNGAPGVVLKFAENGQLPGKAAIQLKMDYLLREYLDTGLGLSVYYFNNQTGKLELVAKDLLVVSDTFLEFPITHCSYYVVTQDIRGSVGRLAGANRFDTAFKAADEMKVNLGTEKFESIIVASGADFADALSGSYLAAVKKAPILLSYKEQQNKMVQSYIKRNLAEGGTVYILGGTAAVPAAMEEGLKGLNVKRLAGANRFETNLKVLAEAGVPAGETVLVCTGSDFADCLSASAVGKPILLTYKRVMDGQGDFLKSLKNPKFCIVGGTSAVNKTVENFVSGYGQVKRLAGEHRYQTSVLVAQEFFKDPDKLVLAYARNYPDGLCGGALAYTVGAPLILTDSKYYSFGQDYAKDKGIFSGTALGGSGLISDEAVRKIFSMETDRLIYSK